MSDLESILTKLQTAFPKASLSILPNDSPSNQSSLLIAPEDLLAIAAWLKDQPDQAYDYLSNATGIDRLDEVVKEKIKSKELVDGEEVEKEETVERSIPGYLEVVYHLYSVSLRHGPLILRVRTKNRTDQVSLPSLTPLWRLSLIHI